MGRKRKAEPQKSQQDRHNIRVRLLGAGEALFAERGIHRTQVSELAAAAGVSVGAFYRYFRDKDELYRELLRSRFGVYLVELGGVLSGLDQLSATGRVAVLREVFRRSFEFHLRDPQMFMLWYRHGHGVSAEMGALVDELTERAAAVVAEVLDRTLAVGGALSQSERLALAIALLGMSNATTHRMIEQGTPTVDEATDLCSRLAAAGLLGFAPPAVRASLLAAYDGD